MKITTKTKTNVKSKKCLLCKLVPEVGDRIITHSSTSNSSYRYRSTTITLVVHLSCLAKFVGEEPEFQDPEVANAQFIEYRNLILESMGRKPESESVEAVKPKRGRPKKVPVA